MLDVNFTGILPSQSDLLTRLGMEDGLQPPLFPKAISIAPKGRCYWNCDRFVEENGGKVEYGWQPMNLAGLFIVLLHHAVVKTGAGDLVDPTTYPFMTHGDIAFIPDGSIVPPRDYPSFISNRYLPLSGGDEACSAYRDALEHQLALKREWVEALKLHAVPWSFEGVPVPTVLMEPLRASEQRIASAMDVCRRVALGA